MEVDRKKLYKDIEKIMRRGQVKKSLHFPWYLKILDVLVSILCFYISGCRIGGYIEGGKKHGKDWNQQKRGGERR